LTHRAPLPSPPAYTSKSHYVHTRPSDEGIVYLVPTIPKKGTIEKYAKKIGDQYKKAAGDFLGYLGMKDVLGEKKKQPIFAPAAEADIGTFDSSHDHHRNKRSPILDGLGMGIANKIYGVVDKVGSVFCPSKPPSVSQLDLKKFSGNWYQVEGMALSFQPEGTTCITATYKLYDNQTALTVWNRAQDPDGVYKEVCGKAETASNAQMPGDLMVSFNNSPFNFDGTNYGLIGVDYNHYASVYSCFFGTKFAFILTRSSRPSSKVVEAAREHFEGLDIPWIKTPHTKQCYYKPQNGERSCSEDFSKMNGMLDGLSL
jgi:lipocalin